MYLSLVERITTFRKSSRNPTNNVFRIFKRWLPAKDEFRKPMTFARQSVSMIRREYTGKSLEEKNISSNPIRQFEKWFEEAAEIIEFDPNAMTLSTTDSNGQPSARTVLLKGFDEEGFTFFTNYESRKGLQIAKNPKVSLTFYWPELVRQVCIEGSVEKTTDSQSDAYFRSRPVGSRISALASPQSRELNSRQELEKLVKQVRIEYGGSDEIPRPPFWGGYLVHPNRIEFWQGRVNRLHDRICYIKMDNDQWKIFRLAP